MEITSYISKIAVCEVEYYLFIILFLIITNFSYILFQLDLKETYCRLSFAPWFVATATFYSVTIRHPRKVPSATQKRK